jgi:sugar phosphate isomerase/epimerase
MKDEHLWPGDGTIDWPAVASALAALPPATPGILEIVSERDEPPDSVTNKAMNTFGRLEEHASVRNM